MTELDTLRSLVRQIAVNHDAEWGRKLARRHLQMGEYEPPSRPTKAAMMIEWEGYIDVDKKTGLPCYGHRNIRVSPIPKHSLMAGQRSARVIVVEVKD